MQCAETKKDMRQGGEPVSCLLFYSFESRDDQTRTGDPYVPNVVRYQLRYIP